MNKLTFDQAYELRSKLLAKLSNLVITGKITTAQYKARVQRANEYTLGKYRD